MDYQVCWRKDSSLVWNAKFFYLRESAIEQYRLMKSLYPEVKILIIGGKKWQAQKQAA